jgi:hypothetical protein
MLSLDRYPVLLLPVGQCHDLFQDLGEGILQVPLGQDYLSDYPIGHRYPSAPHPKIVYWARV